jgi:hypothetical protein
MGFHSFGLWLMARNWSGAFLNDLIVDGNTMNEESALELARRQQPARHRLLAGSVQFAVPPVGSGQLQLVQSNSA